MLLMHWLYDVMTFHATSSIVAMLPMQIVKPEEHVSCGAALESIEVLCEGLIQDNVDECFCAPETKSAIAHLLLEKESFKQLVATYTKDVTEV